MKRKIEMTLEGLAKMLVMGMMIVQNGMGIQLSKDEVDEYVKDSIKDLGLRTDDEMKDITDWFFREIEKEKVRKNISIN